MSENEREARQLVDKLAELGVSANVIGGGTNVQVDVRPVNKRSLLVHCFWYEPSACPTMPGWPSEGPEFYVIVNESGRRTANGRTRIADEAIKAIRSWLSGDSLESLVQATPFIDQRRRAMKAVAARLDPSLRWEICGDEGDYLWIHGSGRHCRICGETCDFLIGQELVASTRQSPDVTGDVAAWIKDGVSLVSLEARNIQVERHADVVEVDPARANWLRVLDRIANPDDVLFPLAPLIARLSENRVASQFYAYSSHDRLCFSASSHYPWVGEYSVVRAANPGQYMVGDANCSLEEAIARIEAELEASPIRPFFGSEPDYEIGLIAESLKRQGSALRPEIIQNGGWSHVCLSKDSRRCLLDSRSIRCFDGPVELRVACENIDVVAAVAIRFMEELADLADLV